MTEMVSDALLRKVLIRDRVITVVGLSDRPDRPSFRVAAYMQRHGYRIVPVNPRLAGRQVLGETVYATLAEAQQALHAEGSAIGMVDVFRRAEDVPPVVDEAIAVGAQSVWLQLGIRHEQAIARAAAAGLDTVQDLCLKIEHERLDIDMHEDGAAAAPLR
jgi:uncharacterized protein